MSLAEGFVPLNGSVGNSAPATGGKRRSHKKLRMVKKSTVRRMLRSKGLKMRGGGDAGAPPGDSGASMGGRRRRKSRGRSTRRRRSLFGMKY